MKKDNKQRLFEVMGKLDKTFKPKLNENVGGGLSPQEQDILNDIISVNESGGDWWSKFVEYGRKGMLTAAVVLALAFSSQATNTGKSADVIKAGIEMTEGNHEADLLYFLIGYTNGQITHHIQKKTDNPDLFLGLKSVRDYAVNKLKGSDVKLDDATHRLMNGIVKSIGGTLSNEEVNELIRLGKQGYDPNQRMQVNKITGSNLE